MKLGLSFQLPLLAFLFTALTFPGTRVVPVASQNDRQVFVRVNQLGFRPGDPKSAVALAREPLQQKFSVIDTATRHVVLDGALRPLVGRLGLLVYHGRLA